MHKPISKLLNIESMFLYLISDSSMANLSSAILEGLDNEGITLPLSVRGSFSMVPFDSNWLGPRDTAYEIRQQIPNSISVSKENIDQFIRLCTLRHVYSMLDSALSSLNEY